MTHVNPEPEPEPPCFPPLAVAAVAKASIAPSVKPINARFFIIVKDVLPPVWH